MYATYNNLGASENKQVDQTGLFQIENKHHKTELLTTNNLVCIEIYADWCGPCKAIASRYATMAAEYQKSGALLVKYNYNNMSDEEKKQYNAIPMFEFYRNGKLVGDKTVVGADLDKVEVVLNELLGIETGSFSNSQFTKNAIRNFRPI